MNAGFARRVDEHTAISRDSIAVMVLLFLTNAVYILPSVLTGKTTLFGWDYALIHARRLEFARQAIESTRHLPGWYSREMLGSPFAANLHNFPWIPSRLLLLAFDPQIAYPIGIAIAATLSALFMYLFCRRIGLTQLGACAAAWTFSCAGSFSSRITTGVLTMLEAYPALPLLLWLTDRAIDLSRARFRRRDLFLLAVGCASVAVAGHPQLPAYAIATTLIYVVWRRADWADVRALYSAVGLASALICWRLALQRMLHFGRRKLDTNTCGGVRSARGSSAAGPNSVESAFHQRALGGSPNA